MVQTKDTCRDSGRAGRVQDGSGSNVNVRRRSRNSRTDAVRVPVQIRGRFTTRLRKRRLGSSRDVLERGKRGMAEKEILDWMDHTFNVDYPRKGMLFAVGNQAKRPHVWQLLGVLRVRETYQLYRHHF
jgi:hypothetical protein